MPVESRGSSFRVRIRVAGSRHTGPWRGRVAAAEADLRELEAARDASADMSRAVAQLHTACPEAKAQRAEEYMRGTFRAHFKKSGHTYSGPRRTLKAEAVEDAKQLLASAGISIVALQAALALRRSSRSVALGEPLQDTAAFRITIRDMFRSAQWLCRFTFRDNEYQEVMELDLRYMEPCLVAGGTFVPDCSEKLQRKVPHHHLHAGCPVVALRGVTEEKDLGMFAFGHIDANTLRALVAFNDVNLADDEALQQDPNTASAIRVKRSVGCVLSENAGGTEAVPHRVKLRCAGPASAVNWMLRAQPGQVFQVVLGQTETLGEYSVLWHVPVAAEQVPAVTSFWKHISITESQEEGFEFDKDWSTPLKRLRGMRDGLPQEERDSAAWLGDAFMAS